MAPTDESFPLLGDNSSPRNTSQDRLEKVKNEIEKVHAGTIYESVKGTLLIMHDILEIRKIRDEGEAKAFVLRERGDLLQKEVEVYREKDAQQRGHRLEKAALIKELVLDLKTVLGEHRHNDKTVQLLIELYTEVVRKVD
jgi:hypothetical protein